MALATLGKALATGATGLLTSAVGGTAAVLATKGERKRKQRMEGLLKGKYSTTASTQGTARGIREAGKRALDADTREERARLERAAGAGIVNPFMVQRELASLRNRRAASLAQLARSGEVAAMQRLAAKRAELRADIDKIPTAFDRFQQGAAMAQGATQSGAQMVDVARKLPIGGGTNVTNPAEVEDVANNFGEGR